MTKWFILAVAAAGLSGCTTFREQAAVTPLSVIEAKADFCAAIIKRPNGQTIAARPFYGTLCVPEFNSDQSEDYLFGLMMFSDAVCARELSSLSVNQRAVNTTLSTSATIFGSAATVVTGGLADDILAALSTLSNSTRDHISSEVYREAEPELVTLLIESDRRRIAEDIRDKLSAGNDYGVGQMTYDANRYHQACSYYHGLALLRKAASEKARELNPDDNQDANRTRNSSNAQAIEPGEVQQPVVVNPDD